ncbi:MAG: hypothetical protein IT371_11300 [Deltaproteobacteria bacterium]|nr:hypothetical protein [Deltaproteobacteria bacterium]
MQIQTLRKWSVPVGPLAALIGLGLGGCHGEGPDPSHSSRAQTACQSQRDCPPTELCGPQGLCVLPGTAGTPTPGSNPTPAPAPTTPPAPPPPPAAENCTNNKDDNGDGKIDCADVQCMREPVCQKASGCQGKNCPCDILAQNCAAPTDRCWPMGVAASDGGCYAAGQGRLGDPCIEPPVNVPKACSKGLLCVVSSSDPKEMVGTCRTLCGTGKPCPTGFDCRKLDFGSDGASLNWGVCVVTPPPPPPPPPPPCDLFKQSCTDATKMCAPQVHAQPNHCVPKGTVKENDPCVGMDDCGPKLVCVTPAGYTPGSIWFGFGNVRGGNCLPACAPGPKSGCTGTAVCSPILDGSLGERKDLGACWDGSAP